MPSHPRRRLRFFLLTLAALITLALIWDWNWFRPLVERQASAALGRKVTLQHLEARLLTLHPRLILDGIAIDNPEGFAAEPRMVDVQRLALRIDARALFHRNLSFEQLQIDQPRVELLTDAQGHPNWALALTQNDVAPSPDPWTVEIADLVINDGHLHFLDPSLKSDFHLGIHTEEVAGGGEPKLMAQIDGQYAGQPIEGSFAGSSVLTLRDAAKPYVLELKLANGKTHVDLGGTLLQPLNFGGAQVRLDLQGDNLADLGPLTGIPLPQTAPYRLTGSLDYAAGRVRFTDFSGRVGSSDLYGDLAIAYGGARPDIVANLGSQKIVLADLAGFIGATPGKADAPNDTAQQKAERARKKAGGKLLPDTPLSLPKLRAADVHLSYAGEHIEGASMPFDKIMAKLDIVNGRIKVKPLSFTVGSGQIAMNLDLDAQDDVIQASGDVDFRHIELGHLLKGSSVFRGAGIIGGRARLTGRGNSLSQMLGRGNGEVQLFMNDGNLSALLVDLAGLDFGNALLSALGLPRRADLRCLVADLGLKEGLLNTRTMLVDTDKANVVGEGAVNFSNEDVSFKLSTQPKYPSIGALTTPIWVRGTLADPKIRPDKELGIRGGAAVALGVFLTPLAALLPTIQLGLGEDHDCKALVSSVEAAAKGPAPAKRNPQAKKTAFADDDRDSRSRARPDRARFQAGESSAQ